MSTLPDIDTLPPTTADEPFGPDADAASERGYVLAMTALLLIPMMVFAALAVDVGGWYARSSEIQRAADAAALAAVVYMPNEANATTAALDAAAQNGFVHGQNGVNVQVTRVNSQSVRVDVTADGDFYFGGAAVQDDVAIQRYATAEYNLPVPMGNPSSALGTGNQAQAGNPADGVQLSVNAYCTGREQGDQISVRWQGSSYTCPNNGTANPTYDAEGFYYVIDFPSGALTQSWTVQFYEPGVCSSREDSGYGQANGTALQVRLYQADDTRITDEDNIVDSNLWPSLPSNQTVKTFGLAEGCVQNNVNSRWVSAYTIPSGAKPGRWILNTRTRAVTTERGLNNFAIRVVPTNNLNAVCTTANGVNLTTCPRIFAKEYLSVYAAADDSWGVPILTAGNPAAFFLAEIGPEHAGKTLEIELYDPGEGMRNMQIVAPNLTRPAFTWETTDAARLGILGITDDPPTANSTCATNASAGDPTTNVSGNYACLIVDAQPNNNGRFPVFNGETVRIKLTIPANSGCVGSYCWWRIRYEPKTGVSVTDRTVWSVRVIGDPVRLTE